MKTLRKISRRTKVRKAQKHVDVMFGLAFFEHLRIQVQGCLRAARFCICMCAKGMELLCHHNLSCA